MPAVRYADPESVCAADRFTHRNDGGHVDEGGVVRWLLALRDAHRLGDLPPASCMDRAAGEPFGDAAEHRPGALGVEDVVAGDVRVLSERVGDVGRDVMLVGRGGPEPGCGFLAARRAALPRELQPTEAIEPRVLACGR